MKTAALTGFWILTARFEGSVKHMYLDIIGLVTTAIGNLIDPMGAALTLPWKKPDGSRATVSEISAEWSKVKALKGQKNANGVLYTDLGGAAFANFTSLRLDDDGVKQTVQRKLDENELAAKRLFPDWNTWPADAQLATMSMMWACGAALDKVFPSLVSALRSRDWLLASNECHINTDGTDKIPGTKDDNRGVIPRNEANQIMYRNAHAVTTSGLIDRELNVDDLYWPEELFPGPIDVRLPKGLQRALTTLGFPVGDIDGDIGPKTLAAVKAYQASRGLTVDGVVGPKTVARLTADLAAHGA